MSEETKQQLKERESVGAGRNKAGDNGGDEERGDEEGIKGHGTQIKELGPSIVTFVSYHYTNGIHVEILCTQ